MEIPQPPPEDVSNQSVKDKPKLLSRTRDKIGNVFGPKKPIAGGGGEDEPGKMGEHVLSQQEIDLLLSILPSDEASARDDTSKTLDELLGGNQGVSLSEREALGALGRKDQTGTMTESQRRAVHERNSQRRAQEMQELPPELPPETAPQIERISLSAQDRENLTRIAQEGRDPDNQFIVYHGSSDEIKQKLKTRQGEYDYVQAVIDSKVSDPAERTQRATQFRQVLKDIGLDPNDPSLPLEQLRDAFLPSGATESNLAKIIGGSDPVGLIALLENEHPQSIALVLSRLPHNLSGKILGSLASELQSDVVGRLARMDRVAPEMIREVATVLISKIKKMGIVNSENFNPAGGLDNTVKIMLLEDSRTRDQILEKLERDDPELYTEMLIRLAAYATEQKSRDEFMKKVKELDKKQPEELRGKLMQRVEEERVRRAQQETQEGRAPQPPEPEENFVIPAFEEETHTLRDNRKRQERNTARLEELRRERAQGRQSGQGAPLSPEKAEELRKRLEFGKELQERIEEQEKSTPKARLAAVDKQISDLDTEINKRKRMYGPFAGTGDKEKDLDVLRRQREAIQREVDAAGPDIELEGEEGTPERQKSAEETIARLQRELEIERERFTQANFQNIEFRRTLSRKGQTEGHVKDLEAKARAQAEAERLAKENEELKRQLREGGGTPGELSKEQIDQLVREAPEGAIENWMLDRNARLNDENNELYDQLQRTRTRLRQAGIDPDSL